MLVFGFLCLLISHPISFAASLHAKSASDSDSTHLRQSIPFSLGHEFSLSDFHLDEEHALDNPVQAKFDVTHTLSDATAPSITLQARPTSVWRPKDPNVLQHARMRSLRHSESELVEWEQVQMLGPDIEDQHTLGQLARMTGNAYALPGQKNWYDIDQVWNMVHSTSILYLRAYIKLLLCCLTELPIRLGRFRGWLPRSCFRIIE